MAADWNAIRNEILRQHAELATLLGEIEALAQRFEKSPQEDAAVSRELHDRGLALYERFGTHLDHEEALLAPALEAAGPEGPRLARRLLNEHHEQRELLKYLIGRLAQQSRPTILLARELQHFADFLRFEMRSEEESLLTPGDVAPGGPRAR